MISKTKTIFWFLRKPTYYMFLIDLVKRRLFGKDDNYNAEEALLFCRKHAITTEEILNYINKSFQYSNFYADFKSDIEQAYTRVETIPVSMGGSGDLNLLYNITKATRPENVIETGVAYGWSSFAVLAGIPESGQLTSIDMPYPKLNNDQFVGIAIPERFKAKWRLLREPDKNGLKKAIKRCGGEIDLCHYDSDKSYMGRNWAYPILWKYLHKGGVFISDDIQDNSAFIEFANKVKRDPLITFFEEKFIGVLVK